MTYAYWNIGKRIIEQEQKGNRKAKYGSYLIKRLSWIFYKFRCLPNFLRKLRRENPFKITWFYIALQFLKCFVLIDLKTHKLTHQDIGQMDMYIRMFDDLKRQSDDNPTIGIILCTDKDETMVKYSVLNESEQILGIFHETRSLSNFIRKLCWKNAFVIAGFYIALQFLNRPVFICNLFQIKIPFLSGSSCYTGWGKK